MKKWILIIPGIIGLALTFNPLHDQAGYRTFVETITGDQIVFFIGYHYAGFFSKRQTIQML